MTLTSMQHKDVENVLHPYTNLDTHEIQGPLVIERGEGIHVYDEHGKKYIEALSGLFCSPLGFSETRLIEAAYKQMKKLPFYHGFGHKSSAPSIELAERLIALSPVPMSKVFFANSGSEANDTAIKTIWYYFNAIGQPKKKKIIARDRAYHGVTIASGSLTGLSYAHKEFDLPIDRILHTDCPSFFHFGRPGESESEFATRLADSLEEMILREGPETIAAFFAEPLLASGGIVVPPETYYSKIQAVLKKYDILLVADEVICGFARTGNMFGSETFSMQPDMITLAKQLSAGYLPISALMINETIYRALQQQSRTLKTFGHGFTYSGHPVAAAVALEALKLYEEMNVVERVRQLTPAFEAGLQRLGAHALVGDVRSSGLIGGLEIVADKSTGVNFPAKYGVGSKVAEFALSEGLVTRGLNETLTFCPPYIITETEIKEMFDRAEMALDSTNNWVRQSGYRD